MISDLINKLPQFLRDVREYKALFYSDEQEFSDVQSAINDVFNDQYVNEATENGIKRFETMYDIAPKATATLEDRRFEILTKINESAPYTLETMLQKLKALCGEDRYSAELTPGTFNLVVRVDLGVRNQYDAVEAFLNRALPANILLDISLKYNTHAILSQFTHQQMAAYTHYQLRNEVFE